MRTNLVLLGGVAAVVGGAFSFCVNLLFDLLLMSREVVPIMVPPLLTLSSILATALFVLALLGLYALPGRRSWAGIAGLVLAALAFATTLVPWAFGITYVLYQTIFVPGEPVSSALLEFPYLEVVVDLTGDALMAGGVLLVAVAALRPRALGRWAFLPFVLALLYALPLAYWGVYALGLEVPLYGFISLVRGPLWVLLGGVLWWEALRPGTGVAAGVRA